MMQHTECSAALVVSIHLGSKQLDPTFKTCNETCFLEGKSWEDGRIAKQFGSLILVYHNRAQPGAN